MEIHIQQLAPVFLEKEKVQQSELWNSNTLFKKGERVQVIAPSGSGKTSFVHFLYGMRNDYSGSISIGNRDMRTIQPEDLATLRSRHLSVVFQDLRLFNEHSAMENLAVKKQLAPYAEAGDIMAMAIELGIEKKLDQSAGKCSYGEQQRIAIIRALQQPFDFIILDEPFSHLDEANSKKALTLIEREAAKRGAGIILADLEPVSFYKADKTIRL